MGHKIAKKQKAFCKSKKVFGTLGKIVGIIFIVFGLLFILAVPPVGMILILSGLLYFFLGRKYTKKSKDKVEVVKQQNSTYIIESEAKLVKQTTPTIQRENKDIIKVEVVKQQNNTDIVESEAKLVEQTTPTIQRENKAIIKEKKRLEECLYDFVVIDFETTGLNPPSLDRVKYDEILSVSIIDQDGNVLLNSLCKPQFRKSWPKAQEIHGITPAMVKCQPTFEELFPAIKQILLKSKYVIAYNIAFEFDFLRGFDYLFDFPGNTKIRENVVFGPDPMLMYCAYKGNERWQKLSTVAKHFKFKYEAHDSLEDVKATLHCYKKMLEYVVANPDKEYIIKYGYTYNSAKQGRWLDVNTGEIAEELLIEQ